MGKATASVMYVDTDKKKSVQDKLEWMVRAYEARLGVTPKLVFTSQENVDSFDEPIDGITLTATKRLNATAFVLCQEPSDYLAEKATPLPAG